MPPDFTTSVAVALLALIIGVGMLRLIDANEKEPVWALALFIWLGAIFAAVVALLVAGDTRTQSGPAIVITTVGAKLLAFGAGMGVLALVNRRRGWSEVNGIVDGLIYGAAVGLGFALGDAFLRDTYSVVAEVQAPDQTTTAELVWMTGQAALSEAFFGAALGGSLLALVQARSLAGRLAAVGAACLAVGAQLAYGAVALEGYQVGPSFSVVGAVSIVLIVCLAAALFLYGLRTESEVTQQELDGERARGVVTEEEWALFNDPGRRRRESLAAFVHGDIEELMRKRAIQNRQVSLALESHRLRAAGEDPESAPAIHALRREVDQAREPARRADGVGARTAVWRAGGVCLVLVGALTIAAAAGAREPTATETKSTILERERDDLETAYDQPIRAGILSLVGDWRLVNATRSELLDHGAKEAYELRYDDEAGSELGYTIASFETEDAAQDSLDILADPEAEVDTEALGWTDGKLSTLLEGATDDVTTFCNVLPQDRHPPNRLPEFKRVVDAGLGPKWRDRADAENPVFFSDPKTGANILGSVEDLDPLTSREYADTQGELLIRDFPAYEELSLEPIDLRTSVDGYRRVFEWDPKANDPVRQVQIYVSECGRGYTFTATSLVTDAERYEATFDRAFDSL